MSWAPSIASMSNPILVAGGTQLDLTLVTSIVVQGSTVLLGVRPQPGAPPVIQTIGDPQSVPALIAFARLVSQITITLPSSAVEHKPATEHHKPAEPHKPAAAEPHKQGRFK